MTYRDVDAPLTAEEHYLTLHRLLDEAVASYDAAESNRCLAPERNEHVNAPHGLAGRPLLVPRGLLPPLPDKPHAERRGGQR